MYVDVIVLQALPLLIEAKVEKAETQRWLEKMVIHISLSLNIIFSAQCDYNTPQQYSHFNDMKQSWQRKLTINLVAYGDTEIKFLHLKCVVLIFTFQKALLSLTYSLEKWKTKTS